MSTKDSAELHDELIIQVEGILLEHKSNRVIDTYRASQDIADFLATHIAAQVAKLGQELKAKAIWHHELSHSQHEDTVIPISEVDRVIAHLTTNQKPCDRNYNDGNAHTTSIKDGVSCCPVCGFPVEEHGIGQKEAE